MHAVSADICVLGTDVDSSIRSIFQGVALEVLSYPEMLNPLSSNLQCTVRLCREVKK